MIVVLDDFGYGYRRDEAAMEVVRALKGRVQVGLSLLVTTAGEESQGKLEKSAKASLIQEAKTYNAQLGLHLDLTEGPGLSSGGRTEGLFEGKFAIEQAARTGTLDLDAIRAEVEAQIFAFSNLVGHAPSHVDGHNHVHVWPGIREVVAQLLRQHAPGARVRIPTAPGSSELSPFLSQVRAMEAPARACYSLHPQLDFVGLVSMGNPDLEPVPTDIVSSCMEWMFHPGYAGPPHSPDPFHTHPDRARELHFLLSKFG